MWTCCSTIRTPAPVWVATSRTTGSNRSTMIGARPRLISSTRRYFGREARARAIASICCSPPESSPACRPSKGLSPGSISSASSRAALVALPRPRTPSLRFSSTVSPKNRERSSATCARPRRAFLNGALVLTSMPSMVTEPASGLSRPEIVSRVVVLPAPFGPSSATTSPGRTSISSSRTTATPP